jgi:outer membrane protein assembly factor BamB
MPPPQQLGAERPHHGVHAGEGTVVVGSRYGTIWLLQAATGAVLWQHVSSEKLGMLIHAGEVIYVASFLGIPVREAEDRLPPPQPVVVQTPLASGGAEEDRPLLPRRYAYPSALTALRARDGAVLWRREGWKPPGFEPPPLARAGDLLITDTLASEIGERQLTALDRRTGETRWVRDAGAPGGYARRLLGVGGGRVYLTKDERYQWDQDHYRLHVLDAGSGEELWRRDEVQVGAVSLSAQGRLVALRVGGRSVASRHVIVEAALGAVVAEVAPDSTLHALTDDGIAYLSSGSFISQRTRALRLGDERELWSIRARVPGEELTANQVLSTGRTLYFGQVPELQHLAEIVALDTQTGRRLWRWHSPGHLLPLLKLWGRHTPEMVAFALAQARRSLVYAREARDRRIVVREVIHGQWRRPGALIGGIQLSADRDHVYVATNLGLFAVSASRGRLHWHALPTRDLSPVAPAFPLEE